MSKNGEVINSAPDPGRDSIIAQKADRIMEQLETLSAAIKSRSSDLNGVELEEIELVLRECEGELVPLEQKVDRLLS